MRVLGLLIALAWAAPVHAADPPQAQVLYHGTYTVESQEISTDPSYGYTGVSPLRLIYGVQWTAETERIFGRVCERFGIVFAAPNMRAGESLPVTVRLRHPLLVRPDGVRGEMETWVDDLSHEQSVAGFDFYDEWEVVPGIWTFEVVYQDRVLASQRFDVVPAQPGLPPLKGCGTPVS